MNVMLFHAQIVKRRKAFFWGGAAFFHLLSDGAAVSFFVLGGIDFLVLPSNFLLSGGVAFLVPSVWVVLRFPPLLGWCCFHLLHYFEWCRGFPLFLLWC